MVFEEVQRGNSDSEELQTVLDRKYTHPDSSIGSGIVQK